MTPKKARSTRVIAIANQKGGVGKSTTAVSLGAALAETGHAVLVIDLDPQGNASTGMGIGHEHRVASVYEVLASEAPVEDAIIETPVERLWAVPSTIDLAGAEIELVSVFSRELRLAKALEPILDGRYEFIFLDCPPSLGLLTVNALAAAKELIVPIQCEYYALEGLGQLLRNVALVQQNINTDLRLTGIVLTMFDSRTKLSEQVVDEVKKYFGKQVYDTIIPRTVRLSEAPGYGEPITVYDSKSKAAECYRALAAEVARRPAPKVPVPVIEDLPEVITTNPPPKEEARRKRPEPKPKRRKAKAPPPKPKPEAVQKRASEEAAAGAEDVVLVTEDIDVTAGEPEERASSVKRAAPRGNGEVESAAIETLVEESASPMAPEQPVHVEDLRYVDGLAAPPEEPADVPKRKWRLFRKGGDA